MGRPVVLSNGRMFIGIDESGLVHDFYFPYVGLENLTNARSTSHKIGIWVDGRFSWVDDGSWEASVVFDDAALISNIRLQSDSLSLSLTTHDFVDTQYNAMIRRIHVENTSTKSHEIRLFMHQVFQISRAGRADTALYVPEDHYILDYKGRCCLLIAGKLDNGEGFDQYAVGNYRIEGKDGTFVDAEDGELSGNPVEHGGVDSVLRFRSTLSGNGSFEVEYWVIAADSQSDAQKIHQLLKMDSILKREQLAREYWHSWLRPALQRTQSASYKHRDMLIKSLLFIKAHCDERGSILASGDSSIFNYGRDYYCYCWPRDAAYAIWPFIRLGLYEEAKKFFMFARYTMHPDGYLMHKYQPDRAIGSTWHPLLHNRTRELAIQEDETATVLFMLGQYLLLSQDRTFVESMFESFVIPTANFMCGFIDNVTSLPHASYDLWEQQFLTTTYTVCTVVAGLEAAADIADAIDQPPATSGHWRQTAESIRSKLNVLYHPDGYFRKGYLLQPDSDLAYNDTVDISSLYGPFMFGKLAVDDEKMVRTATTIEQRLLNATPIGGVLRDEHDAYFLAKTQYKGNPWVVCSLWLAQYYNASHQKEKAIKLLDWAMDRASPSGALSEQFDPETGEAIGVTPLVWSHAEIVNTIVDIEITRDQDKSS